MCKDTKLQEHISLFQKEKMLNERLHRGTEASGTVASLTVASALCNLTGSTILDWGFKEQRIKLHIPIEFNLCARAWPCPYMRPASSEG